MLSLLRIRIKFRIHKNEKIYIIKSIFVQLLNWSGRSYHAHGILNYEAQLKSRLHRLLPASIIWSQSLWIFYVLQFNYNDLQKQNIKRNRWYKSMLYIFLSLYMLGWTDEAMLESFSHLLHHPHLFFSSDHEVLLLQKTWDD